MFSSATRIRVRKNLKISVKNRSIENKASYCNKYYYPQVYLRKTGEKTYQKRSKTPKNPAITFQILKQLNKKFPALHNKRRFHVAIRRGYWVLQLVHQLYFNYYKRILRLVKIRPDTIQHAHGDKSDISKTPISAIVKRASEEIARLISSYYTLMSLDFLMTKIALRCEYAFEIQAIN